jgi:hypothetical protein
MTEGFSPWRHTAQAGSVIAEGQGDGTFTANDGKGGSRMAPETYILASLALIDLFWWLRK